jgi:single-strand DNA-binding protein
MASLNKVMLIGNLTRDPEVRFTPKGTAVTDIGLAVNRSYTGDDGVRRDEVVFIDVTFWGRQAETIGKYLKKGRPIYIEGRLHMDTWQDKQTGQNRTRLKIIGEGFQFLGSREGGGDGPAPEATNPPASSPSSGESEYRAPDDGDDIPF